MTLVNVTYIILLCAYITMEHNAHNYVLILYLSFTSGVFNVWQHYEIKYYLFLFFFDKTKLSRIIMFTEHEYTIMRFNQNLIFPWELKIKKKLFKSQVRIWWLKNNKKSYISPKTLYFLNIAIIRLCANSFIKWVDFVRILKQHICQFQRQSAEIELWISINWIVRGL